MATFGNLTDRLADTFKKLRGKGKLSEADVDGTVREIRRALLDADVALEVVKDFTGRVRERSLGHEVSQALNTPSSRSCTKRGGAPSSLIAAYSAVVPTSRPRTSKASDGWPQQTSRPTTSMISRALSVDEEITVDRCNPLR